MPSVKRLDIVGYNNEKVPNTYIDFSSDQLAILLPGFAYTNDSPILYYTASHLMLKLSKQKYKRIILVGKSIGTLALGEILISIKDLIEAEVIWLTPLLNYEELAEKILRINNRSLLILGTEDPAYKSGNLKKILEKKNVGSLIIEGANHSLEIGNNIFESINVSQKILSKIVDFVDEFK
ncbi:hypothetical protein BHF71_09940 [Vulcanibacillus modesticaldus]|uniref:Alpha/beta hydrolase n=1 Tax=Vulcanibacillus modesticaldus TaxID=337097 RepID=A0A1D2YTH5_9BACI|nr:alpha/beta hydrolase [Vulcanibacillus modesticaldus]OEF99000.1 hypothetical protein BHF71_09940 [Vulcanibacillus modesticaldus]